MSSEHGHSHALGHTHGQGHSHLPPDDPFWVSIAEAFTGIRAALQLMAGLQLLGTHGSAERDLRESAQLRARVLLDDADEQLRRSELAPAHARYVEQLRRCGADLREFAADLGLRSPAVDEVARLEGIAGQLQRCQRYDIGLKFYGSGGCADAEHTLSHI